MHCILYCFFHSISRTLHPSAIFINLTGFFMVAGSHRYTDLALDAVMKSLFAMLRQWAAESE